MKQSFFARYAVLIIVVVMAGFPLALMGSHLAMETNRNDVKDWLPASFAETRQLQEFQREFANDSVILASWEGCTLEDPRLEAMSRKLAPSQGEKIDEHAYFTKAVSGRSVLGEIMAPPTKLSWEDAVERLKGSLVGPDGEQTCLVLTESEWGKEHLHDMVRLVEQSAVECGIPRETFHLAGPSVDNVAIDQVSDADRQVLMVLSGGIGLALAWHYLRNLRLTVMVFIAGAYSAALCLALLYVGGTPMNSVLFSMPAVVYTAGLSCAIHLVNYYRHTRAHDGLAGAAGRGLAAGWLPCLLSAGTTSLGLISLCTSEIVPIRTFGFYSALGVISSVGMIYLFMPAALELWPPALSTDPAHPAGTEGALDPRHRHRMRHLAGIIVARPALSWIIFLAVMLLCGAGLQHARTTVNLMSLFTPRAAVIQSYRWMEEKIGAMVPLEVVLHLDQKACNLNMLERLELVNRIQEEIKRVDHVGSTMSAATFAPKLAPRRGAGLGKALFGSSTWRDVLNKRLSAHRGELLAGDYLAQQEGEELWRITVRVAALADVDYGTFLNDLEAHLRPLIENERAAGVKGIDRVVYTGLVAVVYRAERALLEGLIWSFFGAFAMIAAVMSLVFRDVRAGILTMLPNVWPVAVVFGMMGWLNIALDIGTMMTASVAMGVCVDDTVHFANWFRRATRLGLGRREAVVLAFENSAGAIYQSTIIVALGLGVFAISEFMPTRRFGYLMGILLMFGLVADLVFSPTIFAGRLGKYFTKGCEPLSEGVERENELAEIRG